MRNLSRINMWSYANCIDRDSVYHIGCYGFRQLILSGVRIEYNDQLTHRASHGTINVYNSSTIYTTLQNSVICSNGNRRYYSFPVKIYFANITGSFRISLDAEFYIHHNYVEYTGISGNILIQNSTYGCSYKYIKFNINIKIYLYIIHKQA